MLDEINGKMTQYHNNFHPYFTAKRLVLHGEYRQPSRRKVVEQVAAKVGDGQVPVSSCSTVVSTITAITPNSTDNTQIWPMPERQQGPTNLEEGEKDGKNAEKEEQEREGMEAILTMDGCDGGNCRGIQEARN